MYRLPNGGAKKYLVTAVSLVLPALVVLWLGFRGSPPQSARDFEECVEQVEAKGPSKLGSAVFDDDLQRAGWAAKSERRLCLLRLHAGREFRHWGP